MTNRFISWDVPNWTQEIIVEAKISNIGWWDGSAKSWKKIPARMSRDVKNSTANDITWPLKVMTFFRFLKELEMHIFIKEIVIGYINYYYFILFKSSFYS